MNKWLALTQATMDSIGTRVLYSKQIIAEREGKRMNKWLMLSEAFENYGCNIARACGFIREAAKEDKRFNELYVPYAMLLEIMKTTLQVIHNRIDELNEKEWDD